MSKPKMRTIVLSEEMVNSLENIMRARGFEGLEETIKFLLQVYDQACYVYLRLNSILRESVEVK
jgi:hypothetical protein